MINKNNSDQLLNESVEFWVSLFGAKILGFFGISVFSLLSMATMRKIIKGGGIKNTFMKKLRDKKFLKSQGLTDDEIRILWSRNGANLTKLADKLSDEAISLCKQGKLTPKQALMVYGDYVPPGQYESTLDRFYRIWRTEVPEATAKATTKTATGAAGKAAAVAIKWKTVPTSTIIDANEYKKAYKNTIGYITDNEVTHKVNWLQTQVKQGKVIIPASGAMPSYEEINKIMTMHQTEAQRNAWANASAAEKMAWYNRIKVHYKLFY